MQPANCAHYEFGIAIVRCGLNARVSDRQFLILGAGSNMELRRQFAARTVEFDVPDPDAFFDV